MELLLLDRLRLNTQKMDLVDWNGLRLRMIKSMGNCQLLLILLFKIKLRMGNQLLLIL